MAKRQGQAAPEAVNPEGAASAAPVSDAPAAAGFKYKCTALVTLTSTTGDIQLSPEQRARLAERKCVQIGVADGWDRVTQDVHFKAGEIITLREEAPKVLWPKLERV